MFLSNFFKNLIYRKNYKIKCKQIGEKLEKNQKKREKKTKNLLTF